VGVIGLLGTNEVLQGFAIPIETARDRIKAWQTAAETVLPMADVPDSLILRGTGWTTATPSATTLAVTSVQPTRISRTQDALVTLRGSGFISARTVRVRLTPVSGPVGFDAIRITVIDAATVSLVVPAGQPAGDYKIQFTNGDGVSIDTGLTLTIAG